jgi:hypothetical protein
MRRQARKRPALPPKNGNRPANAELLRLREHRKKLLEAMRTLSHLLEEYAPTWYSEEHRKLAAAALSWSQKRAVGRKTVSSLDQHG